jgi:hypothetical protein
MQDYKSRTFPFNILMTLTKHLQMHIDTVIYIAHSILVLPTHLPAGQFSPPPDKPPANYLMDKKTLLNTINNYAIT